MPFALRDEIEVAPAEDAGVDTILGMEASQFRFISSLFIGVFLSPLFLKVKGTQSRHLFAFIPGLLMSFYIYGLDGLHPLLMATYTYLIMKYVRSKYMPHIVFFLTMAHLTYGQIYRYKYLYLIYTFDWTASTMLIAFRLTGAAWAIRDGRIIASHQSLELNGTPSQQQQQSKHKKDSFSLLTNQQKDLSILKDMSLLEVLGLAFFFPGFTCGPYPEVKRYLEFVESTGTFASLPNPLRYENRALRRKVAEFAVSAGVFLTLSDTLNEDLLRDDTFVEKTNVFERILFMIAAVNAGSCKYYIVWSLGELGHILAGVSYDGVDPTGKEKWDGCLQMDLKKFYTFKTCREVTNSWNKCAQNFLKINVYQRVRPFVNRNVAQFITFTLSAFWHGVYPGYFIFFLSAIFFTVLLEYTNYKILPHFFTSDGKPHSAHHKSLYDLICWFTAQYALTYIILAFRAFSVERTLDAWGSVWFSGHLVVFGYFALGLALPRVPQAFKQGFPYIPKYVMTRGDDMPKNDNVNVFDTNVAPIAPIEVVTEK